MATDIDMLTEDENIAAAAAASAAAAAMEAAGSHPCLQNVSKTEASQQESGTNSYYYWHSKVPQGEAAAPKPTPVLLATDSAKSGPTSTKAISAYSLLDEGEVLKIYVKLEGELDQVNADDIEAEFAKRSCTITLMTPSTLHRLHVPTLMHEILPEKCKTKVTKSRKLIIALAKRDVSREWKALRAF